MYRIRAFALVGESANAHWREPPSRHGKWRAALRTDRSVRLRRQWQGDELDLDAAIEWQVDRRSSRDPGQRIFRDAGRASPALSLLVLVDLSESCNDLVANTDLRLLDLQKQALRLLAKRLDGSTMRLAIHGFHSDTRKSISYFRMLDFGARLDSGGERALQGLRAAYSTRLGAALRHASGMVAHETNARRVIVVLSDGEPSDIDVHDREYLLEDARHAVHEARRNRVNVASLVVGDTGAASARAIYGAGAYAVARNPAELPARLFGFLERLARM
ncbi:nitric oxide reductase activation protein NorD [Diaphorobacter aerolatus]|uniref:VWA domain-containing protein n=1 Tax=Diaphorobacter aerolatus TaxID=1288495 RepID=A0A7H0GJ28_9BURK|nr:VWA domain-containing protein [Diaphorobacter aerolatus]QNP48294.1 VWA domain-containing protein [Diaphorobacter aerolatus]